ncbi:DUF2177 family protein [Ensifer sp.]|jgi:uncharacterized membrane protein|uniref:DUF2177 family protein n=1 Tax=Ensifer sp. TaxID=1872086 RepID=UPI002E1371E3|nr:DUF2177 family protein [Ensifer sp.]
MIYVVSYAATALVFMGLDFLWLVYATPTIYRSRLGELLLAQPNLGAAAAFYLLYVGGIVYFAVVPAHASGAWTTAVVSGALLGLVAYGTYDMTNLATLKGWSLQVSLIDMLWGVVVTASSAGLGYWLTALWFSPGKP